MRIDIHGRHLKVPPALSTHADRRLLFALGRFGQRVARVVVHMTDLNGPRGGVDKQCRIVAEVPSAGKVVVEVVDADLYIAIDRAADRLGRAIARKLERQRASQLSQPLAS